MDTGILDTMLATIAGYTTGSSGTITGYATSLYGILILLDFILAVLLNIGETDHIKQLVRKVLFYGFWIWIIREWGTLCDALLDSLMITGTAVGGVDASVLKTPSLLIDSGLEIAKPYMDYASEMSWLEITTSPLNWLMAVIGYAGVVLAFGILALQIFITYVEFYIASALLLIFIPWGSFKYTSFVAEKAIGAVISYGTKLMMLGAVYGLSSGIINSMSINLVDEPEPGAVLASMLGPFALCLLCWQAPGDDRSAYAFSRYGRRNSGCRFCRCCCRWLGRCRHWQYGNVYGQQCCQSRSRACRCSYGRFNRRRTGRRWRGRCNEWCRGFCGVCL